MNSPLASTSVTSPHELDMARAMLISYAQDLNRMCEQERRAARELAAANRRLERLDRMKLDFLSFISHELRTPLTAIAAVDMVDNGGSDADTTEAIEIVRAGHERLSGLVEAGLEYFGWMGTTTLAATEQVDLQELIEQIGLDERLRIEAEVVGTRRRLLGDRAALRRMLCVLFENAARFSSTPVRANLHFGIDTATVTVTDSGVGFLPELAEEIFLPFTIADITHHSRGTGLSLAIARAIAGAHGGTLLGSSPGLGRGACFQVEIPVHGPGQTPSQP
jgi:signal transduction histidine kinase